MKLTYDNLKKHDFIKIPNYHLKQENSVADQKAYVKRILFSDVNSVFLAYNKHMFVVKFR